MQGQLESRGWNQADLERASGVSSAQISRIINGTRGAEAESLRAFAKAFGLSQAEVFYRAGLQTERPGDPVLVDPILADIWRMLGRMSERERLAAQVLLERMFGGSSEAEPEETGATSGRKKP